MRAVAGEQVGAQHDEPDPALRVAARRQAARVLGHAVGQARMVDAGLRVFERRADREDALQRGARPGGVAVDEIAHHVGDVLVGAGEEVLQRQEIGAQVLRRAGDEAQQLGQPPQHRHLPRAGGCALAGALLAAQLLEEGQRAAGLLAGAEAAHLGQPRDLRRRHAGHQRVAILLARGQRLHHRTEMVLHEHHGDDDDVGRGDVRPAARQRLGVALEIGGGVQRERQPRGLAAQLHARPLAGARQMAVERHEDHAARRGPA